MATQEGFDILLKEWVKVRFHKPGNVFLEPIHRLDKPVSGIVLFARTSKALSRLQEAMRERVIHKTYYALVEGVPLLPESDLEHYLVHDSFRARVVAKGEEGGKQALLHYRVLSQQGGCALIQVELYTGRYHQIRVQLAAIGHPIVGDDKYGGRILFEEQGIALHHGRIKFPHPVSKEILEFTSSPGFSPSLDSY